MENIADKEVNVNTPLSEKDRIAQVEDDIRSISEQRQAYVRQWLINIAMLYGKHYFMVDKRPTGGIDERVVWELKNLERQNKTRRQFNYILPLFKSQLAKIVLTKSNVAVEPTTNAEVDRSAARVSKEVLEDFWQNANKNNPNLADISGGMLKIILKLGVYLLSCGEGYLMPYFNPKTTSKYFLNGQVGNGEIGEVEAEVLHPFECYKDPLRRFFIREKTMSTEDIFWRWGVDVKAEDIGYPDYQKRLIGMLEMPGDLKFTEAATVKEKFMLPSRKRPGGLHIVCTKDKILLEEDLPAEFKGKLNLFTFAFQDFMLAPFAQGLIEQLIPSQEDLNYTVTRIYGYKKWLAGKVLIPRGAKVSTKWDDENGQILFYNSGHGVPGYLPGPNPPQFLFTEIDRIRKDMEDLSSAHDTSLGRTPAGVKSGVGISALTDLDNAQASPFQMDMESKLGAFCNMVLDIMEEKYSERRFLAMTGETLAADVRSFIGSDLVGNRNVKVTLGSSLPYSKEARQERIEKWLQLGLITPERARELLEMGDVEGVFNNIDEAAEKTEILQMTKDGVVVVAEPWEEHNIRVKVLTDFMKSQDFMKFPEQVRQVFIAHLGEHQEYLRQEAEAAARIGGPTAGAVPSAPPQPGAR